MRRDHTQFFNILSLFWQEGRNRESIEGGIAPQVP